MKKNNIPLIIIILVFILELAVIGVLGVTCLKRVNSIEQKIAVEEIKDVHQVQNECREVRKEIKKELTISMVSSALVTILLIVYLSHMVIYPLKKMIESKEKREKAEETEIKTHIVRPSDEGTRSVFSCPL